MQERINCPVCFRDIETSQLLPPDAIDDTLRPLLAVNMHRWEPGQQICKDCVRRYARLRDELSAKFPTFTEQEVKIVPTPLRLDAPDEFRGRGVTIAFLDAGFYAHPDLTQPRSRLLKYVNLVDRTRVADLVEIGRAHV